MKLRETLTGGNLKESNNANRSQNKKSNVQLHSNSVCIEHTEHLCVSYGPKNKERPNAPVAANGSFL